MTFRATAINVMIACPGDVEIEQRLAFEVIYEWNSVHARDRNLILLPVHWTTHTSPAMGERPQGIVNNQILVNADILVAIFWTRIGTPTGEAASGTIEEIERHLDLGKPTMIYFSETPVVPSSIDAVQYEALQQFKRKCQSEGLIEAFDSHSAFRDLFSRQLAQTVIRSFRATTSDGSPMLLTGETESEMMNRLSIPELSEDAQELVCEASLDPRARIMVLRVSQGTIVKANNKDFAEVGNARSEVSAVAAVEELLGHNLIVDHRGRGEIFTLTQRGFEVADILKESRG